MDEQGRHTAAITAVFLLLTTVLIAYNVLNAPPLSPSTAEIVANAATGMAASSLPSSQEGSTSTPSFAESIHAIPASSVVPSSSPAPSAASVISSVPSSQSVPSRASSQTETSSITKRTVPPAQPDIDLNTATVEELCVIPKIGPVLAGRILEYRDAYGPLSSLEELLEVKGIGDKLYETLCQYVYLG